jgi:calcineurin-like phosphoesterase family protein
MCRTEKMQMGVESTEQTQFYKEMAVDREYITLSHYPFVAVKLLRIDHETPRYDL